MFYEEFGDEDASWVLVFIPDCDPGKEFEIIPRNRISIPENFVLRPQLKVKVFYGKAKLDAYVVLESGDSEFLEANFETLTKEYHNNMVDNYAFMGMKRRWKEESEDECSCCGVVKKQFDVLKTQFNDLYQMHTAMHNTLTNLLDRFDKITQGNGDAEDSSPVANGRPSRSGTRPPQVSAEEDCIEYLDDVVLIGEHKTPIAASQFNSIDWKSCSTATRKLLVTVFSRSVLATHTLTGKQSPAFLNAGKMRKGQLDPKKTADIISVVTFKCMVSASAVRAAITTKCADENKMANKRKRS